MTSALPQPQPAPTLEIRRAGEKDADALHVIAAEAFPMACPPGSTRENMDAFITANLSAQAFAHHLADPARTLFVAELDERAIGYSMLIAGEPSDAAVAAAVVARPTVELSKFYVLPAGQGQGVAAALMSATLDDAAFRGALSVWLGVNEHNARAIRFYDKHGFVTVGTKRFRLGDLWEDDFVKERPLAS